MNTSTLPRLTARGYEIDTSPEHFGEMRPSTEIVDDADALRGRMIEDGYLYLPGYLDRDGVLEARRDMMHVLAAHDYLDPAYPAFEGVAKSDEHPPFALNWAHHIGSLQKVLYAGHMMDFFANFLGGEVRHFDFTWTRAVPPKFGTPPHCDIVYMGRGTTNLYTAWTPFGDISYDIGGLMILENSHRHEKLRNTYGRKDADEYCTNRRDELPQGPGGGGQLKPGGVLSDNPVRLRAKLGGRWLTAEYSAGDVLIFSMYTVHASLDNHSNRIRLSSDSRYQLASEPADERWIGENPIAHGPEAKRGMIC